MIFCRVGCAHTTKNHYPSTTTEKIRHIVAMLTQNVSSHILSLARRVSEAVILMPRYASRIAFLGFGARCKSLNAINPLSKHLIRSVTSCLQLVWRQSAMGTLSPKGRQTDTKSADKNSFIFCESQVVLDSHKK